MEVSALFRRRDFIDREDYLRALRDGGIIPPRSVLVGLEGAKGEEAQHMVAMYGLPEIIRRPKRPSHWISRQDLYKAYNGVAFSNQRGVVLNAHITMVWKTVCRDGPETYSGALQLFQELFRKWCAEREFPCHGIYCWENGPRNGVHSHLLVHVPYTYKDKLQEWSSGAIKTITGNDSVDWSDREEDKPATLCIRHRHDDDWRAQWTVFAYMMKGVDGGLLERVTEDGKEWTFSLPGLLNIRPRAQGEIWGKRVGVFRSIDAAAQRRCAFESLLSKGLVGGGCLVSDYYLKESSQEQARNKVQAAVCALRI